MCVLVFIYIFIHIIELRTHRSHDAVPGVDGAFTLAWLLLRGVFFSCLPSSGCLNSWPASHLYIVVLVKKRPLQS